MNELPTAALETTDPPAKKGMPQWALIVGLVTAIGGLIAGAANASIIDGLINMPINFLVFGMGSWGIASLANKAKAK